MPQARGGALLTVPGIWGLLLALSGHLATGDESSTLRKEPTLGRRRAKSTYDPQRTWELYRRSWVK